MMGQKWEQQGCEVLLDEKEAQVTRMRERHRGLGSMSNVRMLPATNGKPTEYRHRQATCVANAKKKLCLCFFAPDEAVGYGEAGAVDRYTSHESFLGIFDLVHTSHCGSRCRSVCLTKITHAHV